MKKIGPVGKGRVRQLRFSVLTDSVLQKLSVTKRRVLLSEPATVLPDGLSSEVSSKKYGSVIDPRMGSDQTGHVCETCFKKVDVGEQFDCPGHLGHIALVRPQTWLLFVPNLIQCLHNVCPFCSCRVAKLQIRREKTSVKSIDGFDEDFSFEEDDAEVEPDEDDADDDEAGLEDDEAGLEDDEDDDDSAAAPEDDVDGAGGLDGDDEDEDALSEEDVDAADDEDDARSARVDDDISELLNTDDEDDDDDTFDDMDEEDDAAAPVPIPAATAVAVAAPKKPAAAMKKATSSLQATAVAKKSTYWKCGCFDPDANVKFRYYARKNPDKTQNDSGVHIEVKVTAKRLNPATGRRVEVTNKFIVPNSYVYKILSRITPSDWRFMYHTQFKEYRNHPLGTKRPPPYKPTDLMVNFLPVLPPVDRPSKTLDNKKQADYITRLLNQVISRNNWLARHIKSLEEDAAPKPPRKKKTGAAAAAAAEEEKVAFVNPFVIKDELVAQHVGPLYGVDRHLNFLCKDFLTLNGVPVGCAESKPVVDLFRGERSLGSAVAALVDKTSKPGVTSRNLAQRAQGKDGRFRGTLMGKRVNFSARTVITPDPDIAVDEVSIPYAFARSLTVPVKVTALNIEVVRSWVRKGDVRLIVHEHDSGENRRIWCDAEQLKPEILELNARENIFVGAIVHRFLIDGDIVIMNRQPTLHKPSMQGHRVRIQKPVEKNVKYVFGNVVHKRPTNGKSVFLDGFSTSKDDLTIGLNLSVTRPYNADFDGDEMNLHVPQTLTAQAEVRTLMSVKQQLGSRFIGIVQDTLMGAYLMSKADVFLSEEFATWIYAYAAFRFNDGRPDTKLPDMPPPAILKPKRMWTGRQLLNLVLHATPVSFNADANLFGPTEPDLVIVRGEFVAGQIRKPHFGEGGYVFSTVYINYGAEKAANVINYFQALVKPYVLRRGISVGIVDCVPSDDVRTKLEAWRESIHEKIEKIDPKDEGAIQGVLQKLRTEMASIVIGGVRKNRIREMATAGSKGSDNNLVQIQGALAQQIVQGRRPFGDEAARVFTVDPLEGNERNVTSRGFVRNSLVDGITPREFFCHASGGREGIIDTGCKTALAGYSTRKMSCVTEGAVSNYVGGVTNQAVLQSVLTAPMYADGVNVSMLLRHFLDIHKVEKLQELLTGVQASSALKLKMLAALKADKAFVQDICVQRQDAGELFWLPVDLQHVFDLARTETSPDGVVGGEVLFKELFLYNAERFVAYRPNTTTVTRELNKNATRLLRVSIRNFVLRKFAKGSVLSHSQFYKFLELLEDRFQRSLVQPGEPVGLEATQTLMQSTMQATLNTFHTAGTGAGAAATGGLNYFNALISAQSPKIASTYIEYDPAFEWSILDAVAPDVRVSHVVTKVTERRGIGLPDTRIRRMHPVDCVAIEFTTPRETLFKKRVTPMQVFMAIGRRIGHCYVELTASGLRTYCPKQLYTRALVDELLAVVVTSPKLTPRGKDKNFRGVYAARRLKTERLERRPDGTLGKVEVRQIEIYGNFRLADLFRIPGVDCKKTWCNDLYELQNTLGTGAARAFLQAEILRTVTGSGSNVNPRFVSQIVDYMVWSGSIKPVTRHGMQNFGPLQAAAFEMPVKVISNAALAHRVDPMLSPTSNIIFGQEIRGIGTAITDAIPIEVTKRADSPTSVAELVDLFDNLDAFARPILLASGTTTTTLVQQPSATVPMDDDMFGDAVPILFM
jgi:DNA-directed RNA polymerase beta' subunit